MWNRNVSNVFKEVGILIIAIIAAFVFFAVILPGLVSGEVKLILYAFYLSLPQLMGFGAFVIIKNTKFSGSDLFCKYNMSPFLMSFGLFGVLGGIISLRCDETHFIKYCGWICELPIWSMKYIKHALIFGGQSFWLAIICQMLNLFLKEDAYKKRALSCGYIFCTISILLFFPLSAFLGRYR